MRTVVRGAVLLIVLAPVAVALRAVLISGGAPPTAPPEEAAPREEPATAPLETEPAAAAGKESGIPVREFSDTAVRGFVRHAADDSPVAEAKVVLYGYDGGSERTAITDARGLFEFDGTGRGAHALRIDKEGIGCMRAEPVRPAKIAPIYRLAAGGTLHGRVLSAPDKLPIPSYRILAAPILFATSEDWDDHRVIHHQLLPEEFAAEILEVEDAEGRFRFTGLEPGKYVLLVFPRGDRAPAFENGGKKWYHQWDGHVVEAGGEAGPVEVVLGVPGTIRIQVVDAGTGGPLLGVSFSSALRLGRRHVIAPVTPIRSGADGIYDLPAALDEKGRIDNTFITLEKEGYGTVPGSFGGQDDGKVVEITMSKAARVRGTVLGPDRRPVVGAHVLVQELGGEQVLAAVRTDSEGRYESGPVAVWDTMAVRVFDSTRRNVLGVAPVQLRPGEVTVRDFGTGKTAAVFGKVLVAGRPVHRASVYLDSEDDLYVWAHTGDDGSYRIDGLPAGEYEAFVSYGGAGAGDSFHTINLVLEAGEQRRLDIAADLTISGVALLSDGGALVPVTEEHFEVSARREGEEARTSTRLTGEGQFELRLGRPGVYELGLFDMEGFVEREPIRVDLTTEKAVSGVRFVVIRDSMDGRITLRLKDGDSGETVAEGDYRWEHKWTMGAGWIQDGAITFEDCGMGRYEISVDSDRHMKAALTLEITTTEKVIERDLVLTPSNSVRIRDLAPDSRAGSAGLLAGDVVLRYGGKKVSWLGQLQQAVKGTTPEQVVELEVLRSGRSLTLTIPGGRMGVFVENHRID